MNMDDKLLMENDMSRLDDFILAIEKSLGCKDDDLKRIGKNENRPYYKSESKHEEKLKAIYDAHHSSWKESKEFKNISSYNVLKINSISSSARLCCLYFENNNNVSFEKPVPNGTGKGDPAQFDAMCGDIYYECKCQEIVNGEGEKLPASYADLFYIYFGINNMRINAYDNNKLSIHLKDILIDYDEDYDRTHFNVKQLFTHIFALIKQYPNHIKTLQYIIFCPSKNKILTSDTIKTIYKELCSEIKAIWESPLMKKVNNNWLNTPIPKFISVDNFGEIKDMFKIVGVQLDK